MKKAFKQFILFIIGAILYFEIELNWRYITNSLPVHFSMPILGGFLFILIGGINEFYSWDTSLLFQTAFGTIIAVVFEFIFGVILNIYFNLNVWDYSNMPCNIMGQICLPFTIAWFVLALIAIVLDDFLRWKLFGESFPHYRL